MAIELDYFAVLGINELATSAEVRSAYRRAARANHPDLHPGDASAADRFKRVQEAYETLSDPARRAAYRRPARGNPPSPTGRAPKAPGVPRRPTPPAGRPAVRSSSDDGLGPELAEAMVALKMLARQAQLERRLRRLLRLFQDT